MKKNTVELYERLKLLRMERSLSLGAVATRLGSKNKQHLHRIERGETKLTDKMLARYMNVLNVDNLDLPLSYNDPQLYVNLVRGRLLETELTPENNPTSLAVGTASKMSLSKRISSEAEFTAKLENLHPSKNTTGFYMFPYVFTLRSQGILEGRTKLHSHADSFEVGYVLEKKIKLWGVKNRKPENLILGGKFLEEGATYSLIAGMPHYVTVPQKDMGKFLVIRVPGISYHIEANKKKMPKVIYGKYKPLERILLSQINSRFLRVIKAKLGPGETLDFHRHSWSEEFIMVQKKKLHFTTKYPLDTDDTKLSGTHKEELQEMDTVHFDARIWHKLYNPGKEPVEYIVAHCIGIDDIEDAIEYWRVPEADD